MADAAAPTVDDIRKESEKRGIDFYFAQFVDMYARPSAKLVPAANLDDLVSDGAGFAGFAAGEIGQFPSDPDIAAIPDLASFTPVPWEPTVARFACDIHVDGEEWAYDPRTILRREIEKARTKGFDFRMGLELEYFLVELNDDGSIQLADALDTLEKPCYDLNGLSRHYDFLTTVSRYVNDLGWGNYANDHEDANGQFEQNFQYADALTSCDRAIFFRYMVHQLAERKGRDEGKNHPRHLHAEAVHQPDRERLPLPHVALGRRHEPLPRRERPARARALGDGLQVHRRAEEAREGLQRDHGSDGQLLQAAEGRLDCEWRDLVARLDLVRLQQPHADAPHPRARKGRGPDDRRELQPLSRGDRHPRRRASTESSRGSTRAIPTARTSTRSRTRSSARAGSRRCLPTSSTRPRSSRATRRSAQRSAAAATRTTSTTSSA